MARRRRTEYRVPIQEWEYTEDERRLRIALRQGLSETLRRARNAAWYARSAAKDPECSDRARRLWKEGHRERVLEALDYRARLRATNRHRIYKL